MLYLLPYPHPSQSNSYCSPCRVFFILSSCNDGISYHYTASSMATTVDGKGCRYKQSQPTLRAHHGIYTEKLTRIIKISRHGRSLSLDLNPGPPKYGVIPTQ
jgi:hypothetical protein